MKRAKGSEADEYLCRS